MSNFVVQNGYNLEALGAPNHLGVASDPYSNGHYPAGQTGRIHEITYPGQVMYWVVFCCMAASATAFAAMTFSTPMALRSHGYLSTTIVTIAAIAYYVMASHGGSAHTLNPDGNLRDIYYARYIDWFFTTPLLLLDIILMANIRLGTTLWIVLADVAMIVTGLFGALSINEYRWGYYVISCFFFLVVLAGLFGPGVQGAHVRGGKIAALYTGLAAYLSFFWFGYPIVWGFCEGADYATVTAEAIAYGFLDFFTKVVFGWVLMLSLKPVHDASNGSFLTNFTGNPFIPADDIVSDKRGLAGFGGARNNAPGNTAGGAHIPGNEAAAPHTEAGAAAV